MKTLTGDFSRGKKMNKTPELKPCPFCGGEARAILVREVGWVYRIFCPKCRMSENLAFDKEKEELEKLIPKFIEEWNTRVYPKEVQEAIERNTAKNVISDEFMSKGDTHERFRCPKCKNGLDYLREKFCPNCGQRLNWKEK